MGQNEFIGYTKSLKARSLVHWLGKSVSLVLSSSMQAASKAPSTRCFINNRNLSYWSGDWEVHHQDTSILVTGGEPFLAYR